MKKILSIILTVFLLLSTLSVFSVLSVSAAPARGDGTGKLVDMPKGSGTKNDPYLIASLANLKWIADEIHNAEGYFHYRYTEDDFRYNGSDGTFAGVYFEQICDIDLGGESISSIGGYFYDGYLFGEEMIDTDSDNVADSVKKSADNNYFSAFSGNYNGNGYKIHNGTIKSFSTDAKRNANWACGLFGMIYGATIRNVVLDNITFNTTVAQNGGIVGIAHAPTSGEGAGKADFNLIENCVVKSTCTLNPQLPAISAGDTGSLYNRGTVGGIVGRAVGTTVRGCVNEANMNISGLHGAAGGIVGTANGCVVEYCVNKGSLTVGSTKTGNNTESSFGGIVGYVMGKTQGFDNKWTKNVQGCTIRNCYNAASGSFSYTWQASTGTMYWGGILGAFSMMAIPVSGAQTDLYLIENCYNLYGYAPTYASGVSNTMRVAGLLGLVYTNATTGFHPVTVRNSASVDVAENSTYNKTNEIVWHNNVKNGNLLIQENVTTKTATEMAEALGAIDATLAKIQARGTDKVTAIGYQEALDGSSYRVVLGINSTRWYSIGAEISWTGGGTGTADKKSDTVYSGVEGMVGTEKKTWMASDLYVDSLAVLDLTDIAETGVSVYTIRTYVQDQDDDHTKVYGDVITITFTDGAYTSAVVNPTE